MSQWQSPQDYRHRETDGVRRLVSRVQAVGEQVRESTSNLLRTAGILVKPGRITSTDFDGVDRSDLGTRGWSLGRDNDAQPSYLALNGLDVYETLQQQISDLQAVVTAVEAAVAAIDAQQDALQAQVERIDALVNQQVTGDTATTYVASPSLSPTPTAIAPVTVAVPPGYGRASIMAVSALSTANAVNCRTRIQASDGGMLTGAAGTASSAHAVTLTGLNGGTITAWTLAAANPGTTSGMANTTIIALFFR